MNRSRLAASLALLTTLGLALPACASSSKSSGSTDAVSGERTAAGAAATGAPAGAVAASATTAPAAASPAGGTIGKVGGATPVPVPPADRKVIVAVTLDVQVADVSSASVKVATMADGVGGYVSSQQAAFTAEHPSATLVLKVPPDKVSALLGTIATLGKVTNQTQQAEDVTAQFVDLDSRISTARASVERVRGFLARTSNVTELAGLEAELTRRETELEQLVAAQQGLAARSALATVTVALLPTATTTTVAKTPLTPGRALHRGASVLGAIGRGVAITVAFALPFMPLLVAGLAAAWVVRRRNRRRPGGRGPGTGEPTGSAAPRPAPAPEPVGV